MSLMRSCDRSQAATWGMPRRSPPPPRRSNARPKSADASGGPAVVAPAELRGERGQAAADFLHLRHDEPHGLGGVQTEATLLLQGLRVHGEFGLQPRACALHRRLVR